MRNLSLHVWLTMNEVPEFKGNVKAFPVDVLVDKAAEAMFPNWQKEPEWVHTGSDRPYHFYGSVIWFNRIGKAMGDEESQVGEEFR